MFLPVGIGRGERLDGSNPPKFYMGGLTLCLLMVVNTYGRAGVKLAPWNYPVQILSCTCYVLYNLYRPAFGSNGKESVTSDNCLKSM